MENENLPEVWLRGKITEIPDLLQPAAHALLQSKEEVRKYTSNFPEDLLWKTIAGRASVGFHLQHLTGVLDRMLSYAFSQDLSVNQLEFLKAEGVPADNLKMEKLILNFEEKVNEAIEIFKTIPVEKLTEAREVGRKKLPSTLIGLLFHAAEHSQRHIGQMLVTISVLEERSG